jgi:enamine deaminase RidA (YjgF/YER057c/UK114 family)
MTRSRQNGSTRSPYEPIAGFSRAVRIGNIISVAGTAPLGPDGKTVAVGDAASQARRCFEIARAALGQVGGSLEDVIRTRILLTRIEDWREVAAVHGEFFRDIRPVNTIMC